MTPTPKLRFVEREFSYQTTDRITDEPVTAITTKRILQQWWEHTEWNAPGEWRDVPVEKE